MSNAFASWLLLIGLLALVCCAVCAWWLSYHLDEPEDDVERLLKLDMKRIEQRAAMTRPTRWSAR